MLQWTWCRPSLLPPLLPSLFLPSLLSSLLPSLFLPSLLPSLLLLFFYLFVLRPFGFFFVFQIRISLYHFGCPVTYYVDQTILELTEIHLPQLPKCWDRRCAPTFPIIWYLFNVLILCPLGIDWDAVLLSHIYGSSFSSGALFPQQRYLPHPYPWCVRSLCSLPYQLLVPFIHTRVWGGFICISLMISEVWYLIGFHLGNIYSCPLLVLKKSGYWRVWSWFRW